METSVSGFSIECLLSAQIIDNCTFESNLNRFGPSMNRRKLCQIQRIGNDQNRAKLDEEFLVQGPNLCISRSFLFQINIEPENTAITELLLNNTYVLTKNSLFSTKLTTAAV